MALTLIDQAASMIQVAQKLAQKLAQHAGERDRLRRLPHEEVSWLGQSGLLSMTVPRAYGGAAVSTTVLAEVIQILSSGDPSVAQIPQGHFYIMEALNHDGSEEQKQYFFKFALQGQLFGNAFAEIGTKNVSECRTRILRSASGYVINGRKFYSTGALFANWIGVVGLDENEKLLMALVQQGTPGLTVSDDWSGMGQRTTASGSASFENVEVGEFHVIPHYRSFEQLTTQTINAQLLHAAIDIGIAQAALQDAMAFVRNHTRPWIESGVEKAAEDPYILHEVGDMVLQIHAAEAMLSRAGRYCDQAAENLSDASLAEASVAVAEVIALAERAALLASNKLFEVGGTKSTLEAFNHDRHWRNARTHTLHDPVRWKYYRIGNYHLNGIYPPRER